MGNSKICPSLFFVIEWLAHAIEWLAHGEEPILRPLAITFVSEWFLISMYPILSSLVPSQGSP